MGLCPQVEREVALHSRLRHRNIVAFHGHFADRDHVYMLLEYCSRQVPHPPCLLCSSSPTHVHLYLSVSTCAHTRPICAHPRLTCVHLCLIYSVVTRLVSYSSVVTWVHLSTAVLTCVPSVLLHAPCPQLNLVVTS